jgi:hypothetical protein
MNDRTARFAFVIACVVAPLTVLGSASSLYRIAQGVGLALPLALPVALDLTALVAAAQIRARRHLVLAWCTLTGGVIGSAALQVADAWAQGPSAWAVHGALPISALVCFELAMPTKLAEGDTADEGAALAAEPSPAEASALVVHSAAESRQNDALRRPAKPRAPRRPPAARRASLGFDELVAIVERAAGAADRPPATLTRRQIQEALKDAGHPVGTAKAGLVLEHFRMPAEADRPPVPELEPVS